MKVYTEKDIRRFYTYVNIGKPDECWEWTGGTACGRGLFYFDRHQTTATRFIFWFTTGIWPGDLLICHSCDNRLCVNPKHLFLGTAKDNAIDAARKGHMAKRLVEAEVREIREKYAAGGVTQKQLADEYGTNQGMVSMIVNHKWWSHVK